MKFASFVLRSMAVMVLTAVLIGCTTQTVTFVPTIPPQATVNPQPTFNAIQTQAAQTVIADLTKNAPSATPVKPTNTVAPTATSTSTSAPTVASTATRAATVAPTIANSPTPAVIVWTLTPTLSTYNCANLSQAPLKTDSMAPYTDFDGVWIVKNTGSEIWNNTDLDILYISGTRLQKKADVNEVPLTVNVARGEQYTVRVDMKAPATPGVYNTMWAIMKGSRAI